ncbi:hypothetical protein CANCADRAFT_46004 [Tortispora caseinolytica NRRL Y-17796]|uniref:Cytochrome b5 heme-binding domain-containing protein n=1 Tax=Tortispora caseinolytica NRRL Y-17796 TaxID=767744 RepID=A0A1E4TCT9_9ASCO|nr:hypothetical protein CANCADRAFT_46004 [Tortispora caseinolytica NRRL Y-17796]
MAFGAIDRALVRSSACFVGLSIIVSTVSIYLHFKNYRNPMLQRYVVRILLMVPVYAISCFTGLLAPRWVNTVDIFREVYEAFVLFTFFCLLTNFLGGERNLMLMKRGLPPLRMHFPMSLCTSSIDISDPYTFVAIKRGILQYVAFKPMMVIATLTTQFLGIYQDGTVSIFSPYMWIGVCYNLSVTISLYCLTLYWLCLRDELAPFRPMPKFLCIKLIIFASYWQQFFLTFLGWAGVIKDTDGLSAKAMSSFIMNVLMCHELLGFAISHWYAFNYTDYTETHPGGARVLLPYALKDTIGIKDLIYDFKQTFAGREYEYRALDDSEFIIDHPESRARLARIREGMRYSQGGKYKYWLPDSASNTPLLKSSDPRTFGSVSAPPDDSASADSEVTLDSWDEELFAKARSMKFGDYNYPVTVDNEAYEYRPIMDLSSI